MTPHYVISLNMKSTLKIGSPVFSVLIYALSVTDTVNQRSFSFFFLFQCIFSLWFTCLTVSFTTFLFYLKQEKEQFAHSLISIILVKKIIPLYTLQFLLVPHLLEATNPSGGLFNTSTKPRKFNWKHCHSNCASSFQGGKKKNCVFKTSIEWNPMGLRTQSPGSKIWKSWERMPSHQQLQLVTNLII